MDEVSEYGRGRNDELALVAEYIRACAMSRGCRDALNKMADELELRKHYEWRREGSE